MGKVCYTLGVKERRLGIYKLMAMRSRERDTNIFSPKSELRATGWQLAALRAPKILYKIRSYSYSAIFSYVLRPKILLDIFGKIV